MTTIEKTGENGAAKELTAAKRASTASANIKPRYNPDGSGGPGPKYLRTEEILGRNGDAFSDRLIVKLAEKILGIDYVNSICLELGTPWPASQEVIKHLFEEFNVSWRITNPQMFEELEGRSSVFVANHPYGMPDAFAMNTMLEQYRPDFRMFANSFLAAADSITHKLLFVDPFMNEKNRSLNRRSMMAALKHLKEGGDLCLFPGRICSHLKWGQTCVQDGEWTDQIRTFVEAGNAQLVPIHISGHNSWLFQAAGLIHPKLRTLRIIREFMRGGHDIAFTIGKPVPAGTLIKAGRIAAPGQIARALTYSNNPEYSLGKQTASSKPVRIKRTSSNAQLKSSSASSPQSIQAVMDELSNWPVLVEHGGLKVYNITHGLPQPLVKMVSELRFDAYGGGSNIAASDELIDRFDQIYSHLILWDDNKQQMAGAYRYVIPARIEGGLDPQDLVTASIFEFQAPFLQILPKALEMGRAAIGKAYQRSYSPLMLMWRGIMDILRHDKSIKYLIGPVTIPQSFSPLSRHVLKRFLQQQESDPQLKASAKPRHAFDEPVPPQIDIDDLVGKAKTIADIGCVIEALEHGQNKLPVLYRQYANVGLKYVATGQWPELDNAMASLAVLDLSNARRDFIHRYLDKDDAEAFFHGR